MEYNKVQLRLQLTCHISFSAAGPAEDSWVRPGSQWDGNKGGKKDNNRFFIWRSQRPDCLCPPSLSCTELVPRPLLRPHQHQQRRAGGECGPVSQRLTTTGPNNFRLLSLVPPWNTFHSRQRGLWIPRDLTPRIRSRDALRPAVALATAGYVQKNCLPRRQIRIPAVRPRKNATLGPDWK